MSIDEERVDRRLGYLRSFMGSAWNADLDELEALIERIRLELMLGRCDRSAEMLYRAAVRALEDVAGRRRKQERDPHAARHAVADYLRVLIEGLRQ